MTFTNFEIDCDKLDFPNMTTINDIPNELLNIINNYKIKLEETDIVNNAITNGINRSKLLYIKTFNSHIKCLEKCYSHNTQDYQKIIEGLCYVFEEEVLSEMGFLMGKNPKYFEQQLHLWDKLLPVKFRDEIHSLYDVGITTIKQQRNFIKERFLIGEKIECWSDYVSIKELWLKKIDSYTPFMSNINLKKRITNTYFNQLIKNDLFKTKEQVSYIDLDEFEDWNSHNSFIISRQLDPNKHFLVYFLYTFEDKYLNWLNEEISKQL